MKLLVLSPQWGHEHLPVTRFFEQVINAGYNGVELWLPSDAVARRQTLKVLHNYNVPVVCHQHQATGNSINEFCNSFEYWLEVALEANPLFINSHSGRDFFTLNEQLQVLDTAQNFSTKHNIDIVHETHRGRMFFSPGNTAELLAKRPGTKLCADFSHWVCVTENLNLIGFEPVLKQAQQNTMHIHARVGFEEGPQIGDPRSSIWQNEVQVFINWWQTIFQNQLESGKEYFTITTEFGPVPYMWQQPSTGQPICSQWEINLYMMQLLRKKLCTDSE